VDYTYSSLREEPIRKLLLTKSGKTEYQFVTSFKTTWYMCRGKV